MWNPWPRLSRTSQIQLDEELIAALDEDGTGLDKLQFVLRMLIALEVRLCDEPLDYQASRPPPITPCADPFQIR